MATDLDKFYLAMEGNQKYGTPTTAAEMAKSQFGMPLQHYAQQYLFGATGLRLRVMHSISGVPAACKSPFLFDLMAHVCADPADGGLGGLGYLYELEDKISMSLLTSILASHNAENRLQLMNDMTLERAMSHINKVLLVNYKKACGNGKVPLIIGMDSIGGASTEDVAKKLQSDGVAGKGHYDKPHIMKHFCESVREVIAGLPVVIMCINQEKEQIAATPYGPPQKKITGGTSQVYKDGHMISNTFKTLASGDGKVITMRTTKTSFCDPRKIEVTFRWNKYGTSLEDMYGHRFEWAMASARCLADPEKGVGDLRDIADVKISDKGLVTCPQLGCKSVIPEEFEAALFSEEYASVLNALYVYQKIDQLRPVSEYADYLKDKNKDTTEIAEPVESPKIVKTTKRGRKKAEDKPEAVAEAPEAVQPEMIEE